MKTAFLLAAPLLMLPVVASADENFRCGNRIASSDMTVAELVQACGEPTTRASKTEDVLARNQYGLMAKVGETTMETWAYDRGPQALPMVVTIVDGRIKSIERRK